MLEKELINRIKTIFDKEEKDLRENGLRPLISLNRHKGLKALVRDPPENEINRDVPNWHLLYPNLDFLLKLYTTISSNGQLKNYFLKWIIKHIESDIKDILNKEGTYTESNRTTAGLAFWFLFKLRRLDLAEKAIRERNHHELQSEEIIISILYILTYEHYLMTEKDIETLENITESLLRYKADQIEPYEESDYIKERRLIKDLFSDIKFYRLEKELAENFNFEINQDKEKVIEYILKFGFNKEASEALNKVDEIYYAAVEDDFEFSKTISQLKEIFDKLLKDTLAELKALTGEKPVALEKEDPARTKHRFIGEKLGFTKGEDKTLTALNQMLNEEKHTLISKKEKFRLVRNFTVEFFLLLFIKLDNLKTK